MSNFILPISNRARMRILVISSLKPSAFIPGVTLTWANGTSYLALSRPDCLQPESLEEAV